MNYYTIEISTGTSPKKNLSTFAEQSLAEASYYKKRSSAITTEGTETAQLMVINSANGILDQWYIDKREVPTPEEGEEPAVLSMKYYVVEISQGDSSIAGKGIYEYDTKDEAEAAYCQKYGTALGSDLYTSEQIMYFDSHNTIYESEMFQRGNSEA